MLESRANLDAAGRGSHNCPLPALSLPDPTANVETMGRAEAVELFVERAQKQQPGFMLTAARAPVVAELPAATRPGAVHLTVSSLERSIAYYESAVGLRAGQEIVRLDLEISVGAPDPHDRIVIYGDPPLDVLVQGGTHGDRGTVGAVLSAIPAVVAATPGLKTILDLALGGGA